MALSPEQERTYLVENLLEGSRAVLDSELRVKECGEPNLAHKLVPDCVIVGNVSVYQMTRVCNIPDEMLLVIADSFLV